LQHGRACAGQPDNAGADNREIKHAGDGRLRSYDLLVLGKHESCVNQLLHNHDTFVAVVSLASFAVVWDMPHMNSRA
jgi:hypothetical protein